MTIQPGLEYTKRIYTGFLPVLNYNKAVISIAEPSNAVCKTVPVREPHRPWRFLSRCDQ